MPPASRPRWCTPSPAPWCSATSRGARSRLRTCATPRCSRASCRCCAPATARCPGTSAARRRSSGCSRWCATTRRASPRSGHRLAGELPRYLAAAERLEAAVGPVEIAFGHNDLLAANLIDDGERLWLVDWEYAGFNSPLFDLGGLASNNELAPELEERLLELYFDAPATDDLRRRYAAMKCASLLREAMWSMVSELHLTVDFDYHPPSCISPSTRLCLRSSAPRCCARRCASMVSERTSRSTSTTRPTPPRTSPASRGASVPRLSSAVGPVPCNGEPEAS